METCIDVFRRKRCFLWDFDGCLCDTERLHYRAYAAAFAEYGHELVEQDYYPSFTHLGEGVPREIEKHNLACTSATIVEKKNRYYWDIINREHVPLFALVPEIIVCLHKMGRLVGIASNSPLHELDLILGKQSPRCEFELVLGKKDFLRKKPEPDLYLHAMKQLGCDPAETLVFEDTERGLEAAERAGCEAIWIRTPYNQNLSTNRPYIAALSHDKLYECVRASFGM